MRRLLAALVLVVSSGTLDVTQALTQTQRPDSNKILLTGPVQMQFRGLDIRADQVDVSLGGSRFVASGNVVVTLPARSPAEQQGARPVGSRVVLSGGVVFTFEGVRLSVDRIEVDTAARTLHAATIEIVMVTP